MVSDPPFIGHLGHLDDPPSRGLSFDNNLGFVVFLHFTFTKLLWSKEV